MVTARAEAAPAAQSVAELPLRTRIDIPRRMLALQGSWNYETLLGNGIGFCLEPALRLLPGGKNSPRFNEALARESRYFNAHPYLAAAAVGALARAELDGEPPERIERFRTALCGPLGSVGDRLVWAGWLPFCSLVALVAFGFGSSPIGVVVLFLVLYNAGHLSLRIWAFEIGWRNGLHVASALGHPLLRAGPQRIGQAAAFAAGIALPLALLRTIGPGHFLIGGVVGGIIVGVFLVVSMHGRIDGWRVALLALAAYSLISVIR